MKKIEKAVAISRKIIEAYNLELDKGKRSYECMRFCESAMTSLENTLKGRSQRGFMSLINFMGGYREIPAEGTPREAIIVDMIKEYNSLGEKAKKIFEDNPCNHEKTKMINWFSGGFSPSSVDLQCLDCDSYLVAQPLEKALDWIKKTYPQTEKDILEFSNPDLEDWKRYKMLSEFFWGLAKEGKIEQSNETLDLGHQVEKTYGVK